jgi:hypothetical protein
MTDGRGEDVTNRLPRGKLLIWQQPRHYQPNQNQHVGSLVTYVPGLDHFSLDAFRGASRFGL